MTNPKPASNLHSLLFPGGKPCWKSPELLSINRLPAKAEFLPFDSPSEAKASGKNARYLSLDGEWSFRYYDRPLEVPETVTEDFTFSAPKVTVPGSWTRQGYGHPHYTNIRMPFPEDYPNVPDANPAGVYQRRVTIPKNWKGKRIIAHFGGSESVLCFYANGHPVGLSKDSRLPAEFDITGCAAPGRSLLLTVVVIKWSDASFIEDQDQWWMGGLHREVFLYATERIWLADFFARTDFNPKTRSGTLCLTVKAGFSDAPLSGCTVTTQLFRPGGGAVFKVARSKEINIDRYSVDHNQCRFELAIPRVAPWSAESPALYRLVITLSAPDGSSESAAAWIGFKRIQCLQGEMLVNGCAVLINGVNRHEHDSVTGKAISRESMERDIRLLKQHNFNAVRTAHYPNAPYFYDLCDRHGLYVIDEANIESHAFYHSICDEPRYATAFLDRVMNMVARDKNHASIILWSLGNESGHGANHDAAAAWVRRFDPSRPLHYQGGIARSRPGCSWHDGHSVTDIICPMYVHPQELRDWARNPKRDPRPVILCEYSHAMGNSNGGLGEYYDAFRSERGLQGGFIWEWADHALLARNASGQAFWAYGGDFGDQPNDANFVCDGLVSSERVPHPAIHEFQFLAQPVAVSLLARQGTSLTLEIINRKHFTTLKDLTATWALLRDGKLQVQGKLPLPTLQPGKKAAITVRTGIEPDTGTEWMLNVDFRAHKSTWAVPAGHLVAWEQLSVGGRTHQKIAPPKSAPPVEISDTGDILSVSAGNRAFSFSKTTGALSSLKVGDTEFFASPLRLNLWRAATDNDGIKLWSGQHTKPLGRWLAAGFHQLRHRLESFAIDRSTRAGVTTRMVELLFCGESVPAFRHAMTARITREGQMRTHHTLDRLRDNLPDLPRVGLEVALTPGFDQLAWYGRGPWECYPDRLRAARLGYYSTTVSEQYVPYVMPQEHGHHSDTRWIELAAPAARIRVRSATSFGFAARHHSDAALFAATHSADLPIDPRTWLYLDHRHRGLGTASCGPDTMPRYLVNQTSYRFSFDWNFS